MNSLLEVSNLSTQFFTEEGQINAVEDVSFTVNDGEVFGIVGESGSGKSVTASSILGLVDSPGRITDGTIRYRNASLADSVRKRHPGAVDGDVVDVRSLPDRIRRSLRGTSFSMVFQDPMSSFNPSYTIGEQIAEAVEVQRRVQERDSGLNYNVAKLVLSTAVPSQRFVTDESRNRAVELLEQVGIPDAADRAEEYPHQFSGGMLQRAMIAQALAGEPDILIADEPTTALDVTIQAQILNLLSELQMETDMSIILITHNLGVIARVCDRVGVMYAGEIVERGSIEDIFDNPVHPYTQGLLGSVPDLEDPAPRLKPIEGNVPSLLGTEMGDRCYFADRCPYAMEECLEHPPEFDAETGDPTDAIDESDEHSVRCVLATQDYRQDTALPPSYFDSEQTRAPEHEEEEVSAND